MNAGERGEKKEGEGKRKRDQHTPPTILIQSIDIRFISLSNSAEGEEKKGEDRGEERKEKRRRGKKKGDRRSSLRSMRSSV